MTAPDPGRATRLVGVKGRNIVVRQLLDAQMILMAREAKLLQKADVGSDRKVAAVGRMFDILESAVVQDEDREYLMDLTVAGQLEIKDLMGFISAFNDDEPDKPKVRRGRPVKRV